MCHGCTLLSYNKKVLQVGAQVAATVIEEASSDNKGREANVAAIQAGTNNENNNKKPAAQTKPPTDEKTPQKAQWKCNFCNKEQKFHQAEECDEFNKMTRAERIKAIRKHSRCLNCLKPSHISKNCTRAKCATCGEAHHIMLHPTDKQTS